LLLPWVHDIEGHVRVAVIDDGEKLALKMRPEERTILFCIGEVHRLPRRELQALTKSASLYTLIVTWSLEHGTAQVRHHPQAQRRISLYCTIL